MLWLIPVNTETPLRFLSGESLETSTRVLVGLGFSVSGYSHAAVITSLSHVGKRALTGNKTTRYLQCGHLTPLKKVFASANIDLLNAQYLFVPLLTSLHRNVCCKMGAMMSMNV